MLATFEDFEACQVLVDDTALSFNFDKTVKRFDHLEVHIFEGINHKCALVLIGVSHEVDLNHLDHEEMQDLVHTVD